MGAFWQFLLLCIILILISDDAAAIRCFNCSTKSKSHKCTDSEFTNNNSVECPDNSVGCLLEINGKHERRSCSNIAINDCKLANSINYCYCTSNNCNGNATKLFLDLKMHKNDDDPATDNESQSSEDIEDTDTDDDDYEASSDSDLNQLNTKSDDELTTEIYNYTEINTKNSGMDCNLVLLVKLLCSMLVFKNLYFNVELG